MIYLFVVIYICTLIYNYDIKGYRKNLGKHRFILLALLTLIVGLRYRMAPDSVSYEFEFNTFYYPLTQPKIYDYGVWRDYQPLWIYLNSFCKTFGGYTLLQFICALLFNVNLFYFLRNTSDKFFSVILLFVIYEYCYFTMDIIRESLAISFGLVSIVLYLKSRRVLSLLFVSIAFGFHLFACFFLLWLFLLYLNPSFKTFVIIASLLFAILVSSGDVTYNIMLLLLPITNLSNYSSQDIAPISMWGYLYLSSSLIIGLYVLFKANKNVILKCTNNNDAIFVIMMIYALVIIARFFIPFMGRIINYFVIPCDVVIIYGVYNLILNKVKPRLKFCCFLLLITICYIPNIVILFGEPYPKVHNYIRYYPYNSVFQKKVIHERELLIQYEERFE